MDISKAPPNLEFIQVRHPTTNQLVVARNPNYDPNYVPPEEEEDEGFEGRSGWCFHTQNFCPENTECVFWKNDEEDEESGGCLILTEYEEKIEAESAKADFYRNASKALVSLMKGSEKSALGTLVKKTINLLDLSELDDSDSEDNEELDFEEVTVKNEDEDSLDDEDLYEDEDEDEDEDEGEEDEEDNEKKS